MQLHHVAMIVSDLAKASAFYEGVLGLPFTHKSPLRTPQMAQGKARPAGNGPALFKGRNAALGHLRGSLRASRWPATCGVAPS